jgi:heme exporter protein B
VRGAFFALLAKDLRIEGRSREVVAVQLAFTLLTVLLTAFALGDGAPPRSLAGLLWLAVLFPSYASIGRSFGREVEEETLDALLATPLPRVTLFLAKTAFNALLLLLSALVAIPAELATFGLGVRPGALPAFAATVVLGVVGVAAAGTAMAALSARARTASLALPLLLFPALVPLILGLVVTTGAELAGGPTGPWFLLLVLYDVIFLAVPALLFDLLLEV